MKVYAILIAQWLQKMGNDDDDDLHQGGEAILKKKKKKKRLEGSKCFK